MSTNKNWPIDLKRFRTARRLAVREMWDLLETIDREPTRENFGRIRQFLDRLSPLTHDFDGGKLVLNGRRRFSKECR